MRTVVVSDSDVPAFNRQAFLTFEHLLPFSPKLMQVVQPIFLDLCRIHTYTLLIQGLANLPLALSWSGPHGPSHTEFTVTIQHYLNLS